MKVAACSCLLFVATLALLAAGCEPQAVRSGDAKPAVGLQDEMRQPRTAASAGFLRKWLVLGEFPNPPHAGAAHYDHTPPCVGLETDYLAERGGEAAIVPQAGLKHRRPDGSTATWAPLVSKEDIIDFPAALAGRPSEDVVAYAFTTVESPVERQAVLAVGSDDGVRIWLNGKLVHDLLAARATVPDQDLVPVTLKAGENRLLVKVEQGAGGWGFCLRVLSPEQAGALRAGGISPSIVAGADADTETLVVKTDAGTPPAGAEATPVKVEVVASGGKIVATQDVPRGLSATFAAKDWTDGPYEVRCTARTPLGARQVRHLAWYKGGALATVKKLATSAAQADLKSPRGMVLAMLAELVQDRVGGSFEKGAPDAKAVASLGQRLHSPLMEFAELEAGDAAAVRPYGFVRLAYRDDIDDSPQFCRAYLPADYDPAKPWPVVVVLHGYNPENPVYVRWWAVDARHNDFADKHNLIVLEPHGRGNTGYHGIGDRDVMRCLEMAKARFNVDPDRVYLMGYSMGGGGTWHVGTRHTDVFAAIAPIYGGWDWHTEFDEKHAAAMTDRDRLLAERCSSFVCAEDLLSTPVFVNHGDADNLVDVKHSRYAVRMLQRWGYNVRYWEHPGLGHGALGCEETLAEWFLAHKHDAAPARVRLRSPDLKSARAEWVQVTARDDPLAFIQADAEIAAPNEVRLDTENATEVVLSPRGPHIDPAKPLRVVWNSGDVRSVDLKDGRATLRAKGYDPAGGLVKKAWVEGPLDAATQTPFAVVIGTTSPDPAMRRMCERAASNFIRGWETWQKVKPRVFKDTEFSAEDMGRYSLLLIGGPDANAATKKLIDRLPLRIEGDTVTIEKHSFKAPDAAVQMVYPNPLNADRLVVVTAGTSAKGMYLSDRMPDETDFAILDGHIPDRDAGRPDDKAVVAAGWFDGRWHVAEKLLEVGDPVVRAKCPVRKAPSRISADVKGESRLDLSDVLDAAAEGSFVVMQRDLGWRGKPLRLGGRTYASGLGLEVWHEKCAGEWDLAGQWKRLRATIGIEIDKPEKLEPKHKDSTRVVFTVKGDGKELFRSKPFRWDSPPADLDVDVAGVKTLRLEVANETTWFCAADSVDWADIRLER